MRAVDLFAGPGGWSLGAARAGISTVGLEVEHAVCRTRVAAGHRTVRASVPAYPPEAFAGWEGLIASPPCQAFSSAGKRLGILDLPRIHAAIERCRDGWDPGCLAVPWADPRSPLILEPLRWAWVVRPLWVACEQVAPALPVWEHMADVLRSWGYDARALRLLSADYGVPQTRLRAFLLAHRDGVRVAEPTHAEKPAPGLFGERKPWVTMAEALGWSAGSRLRGNNSVAGVGRAERAAESPALTVGSRSDLWRLRTDGQRNATERHPGEPAPTLKGGHDEARWVHRRPAPTIVGTRRSKDGIIAGRQLPPGEGKNMGGWGYTRPATTVQGDPRVGRPGHKDRDKGESMFAEDAVRITLAEAAVLQGFPANYPFQGSTKQSRFSQVGDAVPPPWAEAILRALVSTGEGEP